MIVIHSQGCTCVNRKLVCYTSNVTMNCHMTLTLESHDCCCIAVCGGLIDRESCDPISNGQFNDFEVCSDLTGHWCDWQLVIKV